MKETDIKHSTHLKNEVMHLHSQYGFLTRMYARLRMILSPIVAIERYVPVKGNILDLGCGSGIFANILSIGSLERKVFGVDYSSDRIETAKKISRGNPNLEFVAGDVNTTPFERFEVVTLIDLLHHMPFEEQDTLLKKIYDKLNNGDALIIKDLEKAPYWKYIFHYIQDSISYRERLYFRSAEEMEKVLKRIGFQVDRVSLASGYPHPHVLYRCKKKSDVI
ncbi:MAG: hypothetical protein AMK71_08555 [Nitrospira bacterium SG8_35_4]|nr:MAG: hypothetical protein AMK71_08555 [Nitrospira bacterium SG8_35_4]